MKAPGLLIPLLLLAGSLSVAGQEPAASPEEFGETIDVRVVNLEVVVNDKDGRPVRGLTAADFRLLVDGREAPIDYFTEVAGGEAVPAPVADGGASGAPALPPVGLSVGRIGRSYLVFLDDSFSIAAQRNMVLQGIEKSLEMLGPGDHMALVAFDGVRIEKLTDWTEDRAALAAAFERARQREARGNLVLAERRSVKEDMRLVGLSQEGQPADWQGAGGMLPGVSGGGRSGPKHYSQLLRTVDAAAAALRGFPPPPAGRKVLLLLAGGWPEPDLLSPLIYDANRLGYTVYPVDVPGTDLLSTVDVTDERPGRIATSSWEEASHDSLEALAHATGGRASLNSNRLSALQRAAEDTASYYWLGFSPAWRADDSHHDVQVEVRRPDLILRSRGSYSDLSPRREAALQVESVLLFGMAGEGKELRVEVGTPRRAGKKDMEVPVTLFLPTEALDLARSGAGWTAEGRLDMGALDVRGARADLPQVSLFFPFREEPPPGSIVRYHTKLLLRRVEQKVVLRVSAPKSGALLWKTLDLGPGEAR